MNIDQYRSEFAAYNSQIEVAYYQYRAGLDAALHLEPICERYSDLFTHDAIVSLQSSLENVPAYRETEQDGLRALLSAARIGYLDIQARDLTDERAHCEATAKIAWEGETLSTHAVPERLANEPDPTRRRELYARWVDALSACDDLRVARFESFHASARELGFDSYRALMSDITGTDFEKLAANGDIFLARTETAYHSALARVAVRELPSVRLSDLHHADYFFFQRMPGLDSFFPAREVMATYITAMSGLGIRVEQQKNIYIDDEARPLKHPRAACFRINPPEDVRLVVAPLGGATDYMTLFHEAGHAQHFGWTSPHLMRQHPEFIYSPDNSTTEGYAFLLSHLFQDAAWLGEHRAGINERQARSLARDLSVLTVHNIRRYCAKLHYEISLHDSAQLRSDQLANLYATLQTQATGFSRPPALYLSDVDDGFYVAAYLRAWAFEVGLREYLLTRYGRRWWASRKAGDELIDLWNTASRYSVEALARLLGFGELDFEQLAETWTAAMKEE